MLPFRILNEALQAQRGFLLPWAPVCLALGVGFFFALTIEPGSASYISAVGLAFVTLYWGRTETVRALFARVVALVAVGFCLAGLRSWWVEAPVLSFRYYGAIEGRLISIDRSSRDKLRMTLDQVYLERVTQERRPQKIRISVPEQMLWPQIGSRLATTGHLMPPPGPVEPGGFDFRRHAWFQGLGAIGYTRNPVLVIAPAGKGQAIGRLRRDISLFFFDQLPGEVGAVAAAIITGDRSEIPISTMTRLRQSNLAHLLAISGLHMGLLTGVVFAGLRYFLCLWPGLALRLDVKKFAAVGSIAAGAGYLVISGGNVATERAFVMVVVMLCAVLLNRRAISLRSVAIAAVIVLLRRPENLLSPGFQMSFAATTALVGVFAELRDRSGTRLHPVLRKALAVVLSSLIAGLATAPFGAAHFNMVTHYGLIANVVAVPIMGLLVVPSAVITLCLMPFGLEELGIWGMDLGLRWILFVAEQVSQMPGAIHLVATPPLSVLPLLAVGGVIFIILRGTSRVVGIGVACFAFFIWNQANRPHALVSSDGALVGVMTGEGRALSRPKAQAFAATAWLENDGDAVSQAEAAERWEKVEGGPKNRSIYVMKVGQKNVVQLVGKRAASEFLDCQPNDIVIANTPLTLAGPCEVYDSLRLRKTGSLRISQAGQVTAANEVTGPRRWVGAQAPPREK